MVKVPIRLRNMYLPKDRRNFKNMAAQSTYNIEALQANAANPKVQARLELTLPVHNDYMLYYVAWTESRGISKGATTGFRSVFAESKEKLQTWQHDVTTLYKVGSEEYVTIFPNGISDFKKGNMVERITKFNTLEESLKLYPLLNSVLVDVAKYNQKLIKAFESKGKKVKGKDVSSSELDAAHDAMGKQLFSNFLTLTDIFIDDTSIVLNYFDFNLLSSAGKKILGIEVEKLNLKPGIITVRTI